MSKNKTNTKKQTPKKATQTKCKAKSVTPKATKTPKNTAKGKNVAQAKQPKVTQPKKPKITQPPRRTVGVVNDTYHAKGKKLYEIPAESTLERLKKKGVKRMVWGNGDTLLIK